MMPSMATIDSAKASRKSPAREYLEALGFALIMAVVMRSSIVQAYVIPSGSMIPTLQIGDHILVNKLRYGLRIPDSILGLQVPGVPLGHYLYRFEPVQREDVIVFVSPVDPGIDLIKRVIAIPGDTVMVKNGRIFLNGRAMDDPHAYFQVPEQNRTPIDMKDPRDNFGPVTVPPGKLFTMGDNRDN